MLLTNMLPNGGNGPFTFYVYADDMDGHSALLGTRTIVTANASSTVPFGAIDTPGQGAVVSGVCEQFWLGALTGCVAPILPARLGPVFIDGTESVRQWVGPVVLIWRRYSRCALRGCQLRAWSVHVRLDRSRRRHPHDRMGVTDDGGSSAGVGSRYFTVFTAASPCCRSSRRCGVLVDDRHPRDDPSKAGLASRPRRRIWTSPWRRRTITVRRESSTGSSCACSGMRPALDREWRGAVADRRRTR
jgi:hypothetical protein